MNPETKRRIALLAERVRSQKITTREGIRDRDFIACQIETGEYEESHASSWSLLYDDARTNQAVTHAQAAVIDLIGGIDSPIHFANDLLMAIVDLATKNPRATPAL